MLLTFQEIVSNSVGIDCKRQIFSSRELSQWQTETISLNHSAANT